MASTPALVRLTHERVYSCVACRAHVSTHDELVSKAFQGRHGRAYLFANAVNTSLGSKEERMLMTGLHSVADIFCTGCGGCLGWKYIEAFESSQKYKEGKFIVEKARVVEGPPL